MAFDASPSWSGFNYQGKVALYYALKLINAEPIGNDLSSYNLMLEATEDFEIRRYGVSLSYHQVKAYNKSSYGSYSNALLGILLELYSAPAVIGRVHTWKAINSKPNFADLHASIRDDLDSHIAQYDNRNPADKGIVLEDAASDKKKISKPAAIIRAAIPGKNPDELRSILEEIVSGQNDCLTRLAAYEYDDKNKFCGLSDINSKVKAEIAVAMDARGVPITDEQKDKAFHYFLGKIDKYIIQRHQNKKHKNLPISFPEIVEALNTDYEDMGSDYLASRFKEQFARLIDEYMGEPEDYIEPEHDELCNLREARKLLLELNPNDLWAHYRSFSPHLYLEQENNTDNALGTDPIGIRHVLIKILHAINFESSVHTPTRYKLTYRTSTLPHEHYLPTTITSTPSASRIGRMITENPNMTEILYEVGNLIYDGQEPYAFTPPSMTHTEAPMVEGADTRVKRDSILSSINLIPIDIAKGILNK